jgi:hypothetical protein
LKLTLLIVPVAEWHLVVGVVHRRAGVGPDVEGLVDRQDRRSALGHAVGCDLLAIHLQDAAAALGHAGPVVFEVEFESMLARSERLLPFPPSFLKSEEIVGEAAALQP